MIYYQLCILLRIDTSFVSNHIISIMSFSENELSEGDEDHAMDNIRAMLQDYYGTDTGDEVKEDDYYDMDSKVFDKDKFIPVSFMCKNYM